MAIDMTTVKAISYNNKDVVKIEDGQGNVLWQVTAPTDEPVYMNNSSYSYQLENNIISTKTWTFPGGGSIYGNTVWSDGVNLYEGRASSHPFKIDISTGTLTQDTTTGVPGSNYGNFVWSDGVDIYYSSNNVQKKFNKTTRTWDDVTWNLLNGAENLNGNGIVRIGNKLYSKRDATDNLDEVNTANMSVTRVSTNFTTGAMGWAIWTDGTNYYSSSNTSQYLLDFNTLTTTPITWSGITAVNGARIIKYDGKFILQTAVNSFYSLDIPTRTWSAYTFDAGSVTTYANVFDQAWNENGRWTGGVNCTAVARKQ